MSGQLFQKHILLFIILFFCNNSMAESYMVFVEGLQNNEGVVRITLYNTEATYKTKVKETSFRAATLSIHNHKAIWKINNIPSGEYALLFFHDKYNDNHFHKNFLGLPQDGYGFSGVGTTKFKIPSFEKAKFVFDEHHKYTTVHMMYW